MTSTATELQTKELVQIRNWQIIGTRVHGEAVDHPRLGNGPVTSSSIIKANMTTRIVETKNTLYVLVGEGVVKQGQPVASGLLSLKSHLGPEGEKHYIDQETILSTHPVQNGKMLVPGRFAAYDAALVMVGERNAKGDLADLVGHLLVKIAESGTVPAAFQTLKAAIQADQGYAWGWQSNIAMSLYDAADDMPNKHRICNEGAARFMRIAFDIDVTQFKEYQALVKGWEILQADEPGVPQRGEVWLHRKGDRYTVLGVTSVPDAFKADKFPVSVFYAGPDGRRWTRTLESWNESFTRVVEENTTC